MQIELTNEMILDDIAGFEQRIETAREKLAELPAGRLPFKEYKIRKRRRRDLESEIEHVKSLIGYATEALNF